METDPQGYVRGGNDMYLTPRDMAKFGLLYLNKGRYNGKQIVPASWVETSTAKHVTLSRSDYGYYWWLHQFKAHDAFAAHGYGGQFIVVVPALEIVVVTTAESRLSRALARSNFWAIRSLVEDYIEGGVESKS